MRFEQLAAGQAAAAPRAPLVLAPLGLPLHVTLDDAGRLAGVSSACRSWNGPVADGELPLRLHIASAGELSGTGDVAFRTTATELHLNGPGVRGHAQTDRRRARCEVSEDYLGDPERLREEVLEPLVLSLITRNGRVPLHAAGLVAGDLALLLTGPSGAGKSCLAVAADRAGLRVLSDDTVYLQRRPRLALWGWHGPAHLLPQDLPEPGGSRRVRNGRVKYAVPLSAAAGGPAKADKCALVVLEHGEHAALAPLRTEEAMLRLAKLEPGFDLLRTDIEAAHRLLTRIGAWLLTLSSDPAEAIAVLTANLDRLRTTAVS